MRHFCYGCHVNRENINVRIFGNGPAYDRSFCTIECAEQHCRALNRAYRDASISCKQLS